MGGNDNEGMGDYRYSIILLDEVMEARYASGWLLVP
jgi:hypothetical protein